MSPSLNKVDYYSHSHSHFHIIISMVFFFFVRGKCIIAFAVDILICGDDWCKRPCTDSDNTVSSQFIFPKTFRKWNKVGLMLRRPYFE